MQLAQGHREKETLSGINYINQQNLELEMKKQLCVIKIEFGSLNKQKS